MFIWMKMVLHIPESLQVTNTLIVSNKMLQIYFICIYFVI